MRFLITGLMLCVPALAQEAVSYRLRYTPPGGSVQVTLRAPDVSAGPQTLVIPRAIPMGYGEQPYDRFVGKVAAFAAGGSGLDVSRQDGPRWRLGGGGRRLERVEYEVDIAAMEREILGASDASKVRPGYLGLLGYSVFGYLEGREESRIEVQVEGPSDWPVFLTLAPRAPPPAGSASAKAANFYALADSQIAMGPALRVARIEGSPALYTAIYAEGAVDPAVVGRVVREAMDAVSAYFGSTPFPHYTAYLELLKPVTPRHSYGFSMEHLDSATFFLAHEGGLTAAAPPQDLARTRFNYAHHFAHAWIPKRCYSEGYFPFQWELAPVLDTIWFSEGFGQYAAMAAIADTLPAAEGARYLQDLVQRRFRSSLAEAPPFIRKMPLVELSRVASTRYSEDFRTGRTVFSRGGLMAAEMDQRIRERTGGGKTLRDALRHLVEWSARNRRPFRLEELPELLEAGAGVPVREVFDKWLRPLE